jgi:hypothetical protein
MTLTQPGLQSKFHTSLVFPYIEGPCLKKISKGGNVTTHIINVKIWTLTAPYTGEHVEQVIQMQDRAVPLEHR